ncbi:MAG: hypothetical protein J0L73_28025 [Verrucomicrobia bacterium]|nr:hypothetical protein [Verrucomicrobiota bacterium]
MKLPSLSRLLLASSLLLCSCDRYEALNAEKTALKAEIVQTKQEAVFYERKIASLNQPVYTAQYAAQAQMQAAAKTQAALNQEISDLSSKAEKFDATLLKLRAKLDAYKAKHP